MLDLRPMAPPIATPDDPGFIDAYEANFVGFLTTLGRGRHSELVLDGELDWFISGLPDAIANGVLRTRFAVGRPSSTIDARLDAALARFTARRVPMFWWTLPTTSPADLGARLLARGLHLAGETPGMVVQLDTLPAAVPTLSALRIDLVQDDAALQQLARTFTRGYGLPDEAAPLISEVYRRRGRDAGIPLWHFLARLGDRPVATATLLLSHGLAGIHAVATLPEARHQGIGGAVTLAALHHARAHSYCLGVLQASSMGFPVYQRLGFRQMVTHRLYAWEPAPVVVAPAACVLS